jgi:phenylpropionate dioxygenase-like ring-hydroxylating dioxygenase large terminal subunit
MEPLHHTSARSLDRRRFTESSSFEAECEHVFSRHWIAVARHDDLANPGDFVTFQIGNDPLVILRDRTGELRAYPNVCRHRSMTIVEGSGNAKALQCPYHLWTWSLDGRLIGAPGFTERDEFTKDDFCLHALQTAQWQGWVFVNLDPDAKPIAESVPLLTSKLEEFDLASLVRGPSVHYESHFNWKVQVENFSESLHHQGVHPDTLQSTFPGAMSWAEDNGGEPWIWIDHVSVVDGIQPFTANVVFPFLLFSISRGLGAVWFNVQPVAVDRTLLEIVTLVPPGTPADESQFFVDLLRSVNDEDLSINERTQRGLQSRFAQPGPVHELERGCWQFRNWLVEQVDA